MAEYIADRQLKSFRRVLCATDLTTRSEAALHRAAALARQAGAELAVVHAISNRASGRTVRLRSNRAYAQLLSKLEASFGSKLQLIDVIVRAGHPRQVIVDAANEMDADLVVVAAPRSRRFDLIVGTTAERLIRAIRRPVLVVHRDVQDSYRHVAVAADLSNSSLPMLQAAVRLGILDHACATVVHALPSAYQGVMRAAGINESAIDRYRLSYREDVALRLQSMLITAGLAAERTRVIVRTDPPALAIRAVLEHEQPELLAIGASRWFLLKRLFIGSVADLLLRNAMCDMLVIPDRPHWPKHAPRRRRMTKAAPTDRWARKAA